jgi:hypothetical protein
LELQYLLLTRAKRIANPRAASIPSAAKTKAIVMDQPPVMVPDDLAKPGSAIEAAVKKYS